MFKILVQYPDSIGAIRRWLAGNGNERRQVVFVIQMKPLLFCSSETCRIFFFISDLEKRANTEQKLASGVN